MLDIHGRSTAMPAPTLEFLRVDLSPSSDGAVFVALTATVLDPDEPQLLDQEILNDKITTIDRLLHLLRTHVRITPSDMTPSSQFNSGERHAGLHQPLPLYSLRQRMVRPLVGHLRRRLSTLRTTAYLAASQR